MIVKLPVEMMDWLSGPWPEPTLAHWQDSGGIVPLSCD